jgi:hypothetical protein
MLWLYSIGAMVQPFQIVSFNKKCVKNPSTWRINIFLFHFTGRWIERNSMTFSLSYRWLSHPKSHFVNSARRARTCTCRVRDGPGGALRACQSPCHDKAAAASSLHARFHCRERPWKRAPAVKTCIGPPQHHNTIEHTWTMPGPVVTRCKMLQTHAMILEVGTACKTQADSCASHTRQLPRGPRPHPLKNSRIENIYISIYLYIL